MIDSGSKGSALTIVAGVPARSLEALRTLLGGQRGNPLDNQFVDFRRSPSTHFARWVLLETPGYQPLLVFESNHDGTREAYLDELLGFAGPQLARLYGHCEGAPLPEDLKGYLLSPERCLPCAAFYRAYPERSVAEVKTALKLGREVRRFLDARRSTLGHRPRRELHEIVARELCDQGFNPPDSTSVGSVNLEWLTEAVQDAVGPVGSARFRATALLLLLVLAPALALVGLDALAGPAYGHVPLLAAAGWVGGLVALVLTVLGIESSETAPGPQPVLADPHLLAGQEDFTSQNQITHVSVIKAGWIRRTLLRSGLGVVNLLARFTFTRGTLGGIPSIHFARWVILPDGRLLFMSNFDGSWDSYLGDFIDKASAGLTSIWTNTKWFPKTSLLVAGGARDAGAFKAWTRAGQVPTQLWYSAYPDASVQNVRDALELSSQVFRPRHHPAAGAWLADLR
jgi:hypothetical protein